MIETKKIQSKKQRKATITQLNTVKQIYNRHCRMNDISQEISTTLFENSVQYNLRVESKQIVSKRKSAKSKMGK